MPIKYDLARLRNRSEAVHDYINSPSQAKETFALRRSEYKLDQNVIRDMKKIAKSYSVFVFSAEWCPDCQRNVPVLDLIADATSLEVRVFGHIMRDTKSREKKWAIPPSPIEVNEFGVVKIPHVVVFNREGKRVGEIIENPPINKSLEKALLDIMT
jgi:thiol-disulfide isomerase/thioredoxin